MGVIQRQFHGFREEADGSFVTTEFVAFWFLPLWPMTSYKVIRNGDVNTSNHSGPGALKEVIPIEWGQAIQGWLALLGILAVLSFIVGLLYLAGKYDWSE
jgi:hypothetical protein